MPVLSNGRIFIKADAHLHSLTTIPERPQTLNDQKPWTRFTSLSCQIIMLHKRVTNTAKNMPNCSTSRSHFSLCYFAMPSVDKYPDRRHVDLQFPWKCSKSENIRSIFYVCFEERPIEMHSLCLKPKCTCHYQIIGICPYRSKRLCDIVSILEFYNGQACLTFANRRRKGGAYILLKSVWLSAIFRLYSTVSVFGVILVKQVFHGARWPNFLNMSRFCVLGLRKTWFLLLAGWSQF